MATAIQSTKLDFENIKTSLRQYLAAKDEYKDFNFEAAGVNNILDVLREISRVCFMYSSELHYPLICRMVLNIYIQ